MPTRLFFIVYLARKAVSNKAFLATASLRGASLGATGRRRSALQAASIESSSALLVLRRNSQ
jgi:hypothetical protein